MAAVMSKLKTAALGFTAALLGLEGAKRVVGYLLERLERIAEKQKEIYETSLQLSEVGQSLEIQTGTTGQQPDWTKQAIGLQEAGRFENVETAKDMMIAMDIGLSGQGGIKNPAVMDLAKELASFVGANQMSGGEVSKLFEFAGVAGIDPTKEAYLDYFAKLQEGYTSSNVTSFGDFMTGLQKGGTSYIGQGGSLEEAISAFASARSVAANESLAATLLDQVARFSSGGYAKPRAAVEESQNVRWEDIQMDQRMRVMLKHIAMIPENRRTQTMIEQGFEPGLASEIQKMVTPEAMAVMRATRQSVSQANPQFIADQMNAFINSDLAKDRQIEAEKSAMEHEAGPVFASWQRRFKKVKNKSDIQISKNEDHPLLLDKVEPLIMALEEMLVEVKTIEDSTKPHSLENRRVRFLRQRIENEIGIHQSPISAAFSTIGTRHSAGFNIEQALADLKQTLPISNTTNISYHNETIFTPRVGSDERGARIKELP